MGGEEEEDITKGEGKGSEGVKAATWADCRGHGAQLLIGSLGLGGLLAQKEAQASSMVCLAILPPGEMQYLIK